MKRRAGSGWLYAVFFLSGAMGLVYQVLWNRMLGLVFGNTIHAASVVLSAFMAGLAIGSAASGRLLSKGTMRSGLWTYSLLEFLVGVSGLAMPRAIRLLGAMYIGIDHALAPTSAVQTAFRIALSFLILTIPCTFMGATLPVLSRYLEGEDPTRRNAVGRLYGVNTIGAVMGCLATGFLFIGRLGIALTSILAASVNLLVALLAFTLDRMASMRAVAASARKPSFRSRTIRSARSPTIPEGGRPTDRRTDADDVAKRLGPALLSFYAFSGCAAMALEVAWTKAMVWVMAMDSYAFASMLAVILAGIGAGSLLHSLVSSRIRNMGGLMVAIQFATGAAVLLSIRTIQGIIPLKEEMQALMGRSGPFSFIFAVIDPITVSQLLLSAWTLLLPSILMGFAFPLITGLYIRTGKDLANGVGNIYSANTVGGIIGSLAMGFIVMPAFGLLPSIAIMAGVYLLSAIVLLVIISPPPASGRAWKIAAMIALAGILVATTDIDSRHFLLQTLDGQVEGGGEKLLYFKENATGDVLVKESAAYGREMLIDGVQVASDGEFDLHSHLYPAHLISLLKKDPSDILVVAFGCGGTSGSILKYKEVERLDAVEICDGVVQPAKDYFSTMNSDVFDNPKLSLIIQDGRNYVRMSEKKYDIIYSGPIHPQSNQGSAALYTKEYFEDCRSRLKGDGFQCLWLPLHMASAEDFKIIVKTFMDVYPYASMWILPQTDTSVAHPHLIGSMKPVLPDYEVIKEKLSRPDIQKDLQRLNDTAFSEPYEFISQFAMGEEALRKFIEGTSRENTDDLPIVEYYHRPSNYLLATAASKAMLLSDISRYMLNPYPFVQNVPASEQGELKRQLDRLFAGNRSLVLGHFYMTAKRIVTTNVDSQIEENYRKAYELIPESRYLHRHFQ